MDYGVGVGGGKYLLFFFFFVYVLYASAFISNKIPLVPITKLTHVCLLYMGERNQGDKHMNGMVNFEFLELISKSLKSISG